MMVAEFVARAQSGSPLNGELAQHSSTMPSSQGRVGDFQHSPGSYLNQDVILGPVSPGAPSGADRYSPPPHATPYELSAHIKRKELFSQRKQREFIPDNKKDDNYWDRRRRNNEAAKRSREKRRFNDMVLEQRVVELTKENHILKAQLDAIKEEYGICGENIVCVDKVMASLPSNDQMLTNKRAKLNSGSPAGHLFQSAPSPIPTPVIHHPAMSSSPPPSVLHLHHTHHDTYRNYQDPDPYHHPRTPYPTTYQSYPSHSSHSQSQYEDSSVQDLDSENALNLSSRSRPRSVSRHQSPFEVSSGSGSGSGSGDDCCTAPLASSTYTPVATSQLVDSNNSLPLKLRHKSHLGDKDAATALLSLQNIKQEPGPRASPPWDGEGSSDERDSGISLGAEWPSGSAAAVVTAALVLQQQQQQQQRRQMGAAAPSTEAETENKHRLHSEIVRLSTEVANLKSLVIRNKGSSVVKTMMPHSQH